MGLFESILHSLVFGLLQIVDMVMNVFYFLAGIKNAQGEMTSVGNAGGDLLSTLFGANISGGGHKITMTTIYLQFAMIAFSVLIVCFIIAILKSFIGKGDEEVKMKNLVYLKTGQSVAWIIFVPALFLLGLWVVSALITTLTGIMATSMGIGDDLSISKLIIESCITGGNVDFTNINVVEYQYKDFQSALQGANFNYWLCLLAGGCCLFGVMMTTLTLVERIIHIFFYYLSGPFVFAKLPLDQGKGFDQWKEGVLAKFLSLAGILICAFLFFILLGLIQKIDLGQHAVMIKLMFIIGGVFTFTKAGTLVANLISSNAGQFEGNSQNASAGMLRGGMHAAAGIARGAGIAAMGAGRKGMGVDGDALAGVLNALSSGANGADGAFTGAKGGVNNVSSISKAKNGAKARAGGSGIREAVTYGGLAAGVGAAALAGVTGVVKGVTGGIGKGVNAIRSRSNTGGQLAKAHNQEIKGLKPKKAEYRSIAQHNAATKIASQQGKVSRKDARKAYRDEWKTQKDNYNNDKGTYRELKKDFNKKVLPVPSENNASDNSDKSDKK